MYITSRVIYGFNLGFEVVELREGEEIANIYKLDLGFVSFNFIPVANN